MGLESLQSVFGDISSNGVMDSTPIPPTSLTAGQRDSSPNPTRLEDMGIFSIFNEIAENTNRINTISTSQATGLDNIVRIEPITFRQFPSPLSILSEDLPVEYEDGINIRRNELAPNVGVNNNLGVGDFVLETLYNKNHTPNTDRKKIPYGQIEINTLRAGMGSLGNLDIKGYGDLRRFSAFGGAEPYVVNNIGSDTLSRGANRDVEPYNALAQDVDRVLSYYTSLSGISTIFKENLQAKIGIKSSISANPFTNPIEFTKDLVAKLAELTVIPATPNKIYDGIGYGFGMNSRFPTRIDYSKKFNIPVTIPSKDHGDKKKEQSVLGKKIGGAVNRIGDSIKKNSKKLEIAIRGEAAVALSSMRETTAQLEAEAKADQAAQKAAQVAEEALQRKKDARPSKFFDFSGPGNHSDKIGFVKIRGYEDELNKAGGLAGYSTFKDFTEEDIPEGKGDFMVRFRDLRQPSDHLYFRGYVTGITENVSPSFTSTNYIGRSEPVYVYERAERDLSFNLRVYPNNSAEMKYMYAKLNKLTSLAYPMYAPETDNSLVRMKAPFTELYMAHIGSRAKGQFGFIKSLSYTVNESGDWDMESTLPRLFDIAISYQILNRKTTSMTTPFYMSDQS